MIDNREALKIVLTQFLQTKDFGQIMEDIDTIFMWWTNITKEELK